jgi:CRISPR-associated protein Cmr4
MAIVDFLLIECRSNLHVGSGNENYGVIDKAVQRDAATNLPTIHGSGLKGALREHFSDQQFVSHVFGSSPKEDDPSKKSKAGHYNFHDGWLIGYPVRSNVLPFFTATTPKIVQDLLDRCNDFGVKLSNELAGKLRELAAITNEQPVVFRQPNFRDTPEIILEDWIAVNDWDEFTTEDLATLEVIWGKNLAVLPYPKFQELTDNLPVIARNYLENGQSANLWYEEVVPRGSRFYTFIEAKKTHTDFDPTGRFQLGGNATVGYGQTLFSKITNPNPATT